LLAFAHYLPSADQIKGIYVEPFVGGGSVFFYLAPKRAILADINPELVELYRAIRHHPVKVWDTFKGLDGTRDAYYEIRSWNVDELDLATRAARTLYLNRTCFKGMWRHNSRGDFNVGYGGQARRWVIAREDLTAASSALKRALLKCCDFEEILASCSEGDFVFLDPPYRPGDREMSNQHYGFVRFSFEDQRRLAEVLEAVSREGIRWAMTNSCHPDILSLYRTKSIIPLPTGTGRKVGQLTTLSLEVLIRNYEEAAQ